MPQQDSSLPAQPNDSNPARSTVLAELSEWDSLELCTLKALSAGPSHVAVSQALRLVEVGRQLFPINDTHRMQGLSILGDAYFSNRQFLSAERQYSQAIADVHTAFGLNSDFEVRMLLKIAASNYAAGILDAADAGYAKALSMQRAMATFTCSDIIMTYLKLIEVNLQRKDLRATNKYLAEIRPFLERDLTPLSIPLIQHLGEAGIALRKHGMLDRSEFFLKTAVRACEQLDDQNTSMYFTFSLEHAVVLKELYQHYGAIEVLQDLLIHEIVDSLQFDRFAETVREELACVYQDMGDPESAEQLWRKVLEIPICAEIRVERLLRYARALAHNMKLLAAIDQCLEAADLLDDNQESSLYADVCHELVQIAVALQATAPLFDSAATQERMERIDVSSLLDRELSIRQTHSERKSDVEKLARCYLSFADWHIENQRPTTAQLYIRHATEVLEPLAPDLLSIDAARCKESAALAWSGQEKFFEALREAEGALTIYKKLGFRDDAIFLVTPLVIKAESLETIDQKNQAMQVLEHCLAILKLHCGDCDVQILGVKARMAELLEDSDPERACILQNEVRYIEREISFRNRW